MKEIENNLPVASERPKRTGHKGRKGRMGAIGTVLSVGFVGYETKQNMDEGDGIIKAGGKALVANAAYAALPGGLLGGLALASITELPSLIQATSDAMRDGTGRNGMFTGQFEETRQTEMMAEIGNQRRYQARTEAVKALTSHNAQYQRYFR